MTKTAEFGQPTAHAPQPGKCRVCGCGGVRVCLIEDPHDDPDNARACVWTDHTETLCDNPKCIAAARRELGFAA